MNPSPKDSIHSDESAVRRLSDRGHYDRATIHAILDAQLMCHIGFAWQGRTHVIPTLYGRDGDRVLFHGSALSRMLEAAQAGPEICFCVSVLDALVLARSAFHHSANYRSVVLYGRPSLIEGEAAKNEAMRKISEHLLPGRWDECRAPTASELKATTVLALAIDEGAAKVRAHGVKDDPRDLELDFWAGLLPVGLVAGTPQPSEDLKAGVALPRSLAGVNELPVFKRGS
jgi:nitroimidazol reductase NimA-like FMN-containing flavoprotein (pyridoxamine 5'-phosphate oxidase superfamily)